MEKNNEILEIDNYEIFKYLNPNENNMLSDMSGLDLQDLLILINDVYLSLRKKLEFNEKITFGIEIEMDHARKTKIEEIILEQDLWEFGYDDSLFEGIEVISPILTDNEQTWKDIKQVCDLMKNNGKISTYCGGHIHVGAHIFDASIDAFLNFVKLWSVYENILFRFFYGEFLTPREVITKYAPPMSKELYKFYKENLKVRRINDLLYNICSDRYMALNYDYVTSLTSDEKGNTLEFRCPNGTLEPVIWQNNINLCINLLKYSKNKNFNDDIVSKRLKTNKTFDLSLEEYNFINIDQALELCDMLFTNNLDKVYFLRQYFKSFDMPTQKFEKAKKFVK